MPASGLHIVLGDPSDIFIPKVFELGLYYRVSPLGLVLLNVPFGGALTKVCAASTYCFAFLYSGNSAPCFVQCPYALSTEVVFYIFDI